MEQLVQTINCTSCSIVAITTFALPISNLTKEVTELGSEILNESYTTISARTEGTPFLPPLDHPAVFNKTTHCSVILYITRPYRSRPEAPDQAS